jgi:acetoin utilization protein AcuB
MDFEGNPMQVGSMTISVETYMTPSPHTIGRDQTLERAARMFREYHIRHLPVLAGGHLVGMLTERDVALVETLGVDATKELVESAMSQDCYAVAPSDRLGPVAAEMAKHKYGSAVVTVNDKVVGVLTTVDVCRALAALAG